MAKKAKKSAVKKARVKSLGKKPAKKKVAVKKSARKTYTVKAAKKTAGVYVKAAGKRATAAKKTGKKMIRRAVKAVVEMAAPIIPGNETKS